MLCGPIEAAIVNGALAQADETDDNYSAGGAHPGCAVVPAALAMGEMLGSDGPRFLRAVHRLQTRQPDHDADDPSQDRRHDQSYTKGRLVDLGMLVETAGSADQVVKLMPPLTISYDELSFGLSLLAKAVTCVAM